MFSFYFVGHDYEYESRNELRIFDLNTEYEIKDEEQLKNNTGLGMLSILEKEVDGFVGCAKLYNNGELLFESKFDSSEIVLEKENEKKLKKTLVVKSMHNVMKKYYKINPDYGILTGVRPVKILFVAKDSGKSDEEINYILKNTYDVSPDKIKLLWEVSKTEEKYIDSDVNMKNYNLYIGIPFCPSKCSYCSFTSYIGCKDFQIENYLDTLLHEIKKTIELALLKKLNLNSIYIGGGTPSILSEKQINIIFDTIRKYYDLSKIKEITFEAGRPDTISEEKLLCLKSNFVNRISINPQTMKADTLKNIGREHSANEICDKYNLARRIGFNSINMDIILGLPDEDEKDAEHTIDEILKLQPENITVHSLSYKTGSILRKDNVHQLSKEYKLLKDMHDIVERKCIIAGYNPYYLYRQKNIKGNLENVGYTIDNKESIYNIVIIEEIETILACGAGVSSKIFTAKNRHEPVYNFKGLEEYSLRIEEILDKKKRLLCM
nr:coproporphyrinogen dehydrogenase HemZ [Sedimentibacter sp.]